MPYKVKTVRNDDGSYTLSYGKGSKKLTGILKHDPHHSAWFVEGVGVDRPLKRDAVAEWGERAAAQYQTTASVSGPPAPRPKGPPSHRPGQGRYDVRTHDTTADYWYVGGFAIWDTVTNRQAGWVKDLARCNRFVAEMNKEDQDAQQTARTLPGPKEAPAKDSPSQENGG